MQLEYQLQSGSYRGKPEKFDPTKVGKKTVEGKPKRVEPASKDVAPPTALDKAKTPTPPKNTPMWADSVFGIDVAVRELHVNQEISPSFGRLPDIVEEVYSSLGGDDKNLNKQMTKKQEFCKSIASHDFNIPQPLYLFLKGIGEVKDATGKTVSLADHVLPSVVQQGFGGYHSGVIDANTHNLYEEIPCLGSCGDILMAETSDEAHPVPNFRVLPARIRATRSLNGYFGAIGTRKEEVLLNSLKIQL
ncbi:unnamed protein product, partial [Brenthis ino]